MKIIIIILLAINPMMNKFIILLCKKKFFHLRLIFNTICKILMTDIKNDFQR